MQLSVPAILLPGTTSLAADVKIKLNSRREGPEHIIKVLPCHK
jgi:hypothetical protein